MREIRIPDKNGVIKCFTFNFCNMPRMYSNIVYWDVIKVDEVCVIEVCKLHNHRYDLRAFFYRRQRIFYQENINTLKELYDVIQKLLKEEKIV